MTSDPQQILAAAKAWHATQSAVGKRYATCSLENFETPDASRRNALKNARQFAESLGTHIDAGHGLMLIGSKGTGKDHLALGCLRIAAQQLHVIVKWTDGEALMRRYRDLIGMGGSESNLVDEFTTPDVLLLSDPIPMAFEPSNWPREILWQIVDRRYRDRRPTWCTLNVAHSHEASDRMGPPIMDRLRDGARVIVCRYESFRRPLSTENARLCTQTATDHQSAADA